MFHLLDIIGTIALCQALTAIKKTRSFGVFIIAFVTAAGGGTLRECHDRSNASRLDARFRVCVRYCICICFVNFISSKI
jgi:uncharacterized membrane protein YeiH